jgi:cell division protein FtsB
VLRSDRASGPSEPSDLGPAIAPAGAPGPAAPPDDGRARRQALQRATFLLLTLAAIALSARAIVGERGLLDAHRAQRELSTLQGEVGTWHERNAYLEARIKALRDNPATIERIARERLDYVRPGEITFLFPRDPSELDPGDPGPLPPGEFLPTHPGEIDALGEESAPPAKHQ